jgi:hypothetical protein
MARGVQPLTTLRKEDRVVLFPSVACRTADGQHWRVQVQGDVSVAGRPGVGARMVLRYLRRAMRAADDLTMHPLFQARIARFLAQGRAGCRIAVRIGEAIYRLPSAGRHGLFQGMVELPAGEVLRLAQAGSTGGGAGGWWPGPSAAACLPVEVYGAAARSAVLLVEPEGVSVISDIDDTLKHTGVGCRRTLLANTFLRPFESIPGMAALFQRWAAAGAVFHYVSASPWQLYEHLARHLAEEGFPAGSFHLRAFRLRDHLLRRLLLVRRSGKWRTLCQLLAMFPRRQFVLVGDSAERDPELYGALARRYPQQVIGIWIRQLEKLPDLRRYVRAFRGVPEGCWHLFRSAEELLMQPWPTRG